MFSKILSLNLFIALITAYVLPDTPFSGSSLSSRAVVSAADILLKIAPSSNTCTGADVPSECATNVQAAPYLIAAMAQYKIFNPHEIAAVLSLVALESGEFKYSTNHFPAPGRPGQGTRNMQMPNFNLMYAKSIPELAAKVGAITTASTTSGLSDDQLNAIRALVLPDAYSWGSAPWFLVTQCPDSRKAIQAGGPAGLAAYMACVGTSVTDDRTKYYTRATEAFGL
ncbi:Uncharacterized protein BP5553_02814 [Venustampulla echinocandica]|uniref:Uncharacterized protein n=1 Tax=Venustampulla echinocandica TaxID=2656787 RepID=A0A370TSJ9_9HELO|nr:Uncharacterized protein BP5553_02814 [Venustampulla echinocandica]RDL38474.1 Uncharacterized protein BP5553_02814 [Venustampulla echinocandica]